MKPTFQWAAALTLYGAVTLAGCGDGGDGAHKETKEESQASEAGIAEEDAGRMGGNSGGRTDPSTGVSGDASGSSNANDSGSASGDSGHSAGQGSEGDAGASLGAKADGGPGQSDCATKAKDECEYQKKCDPVHFAREWDGDINQFCVPKRKAACESKLAMTGALAVSEACSAWVHASCDNHRNFYFRVTDSNGKWQYGDPACEVTPTARRGDKALNADCTSDFQCQSGMFCKVADDDYLMHGDPKVEKVCGKCSAQYAYEGPNTGNGYLDAVNCYDQEQCKAGYSCLLVYGSDPEFRSLSFSTVGGTRSDLRYCVKNIVKAGLDKDCAKDSNAQCDTGLVCEGATASDTIGKCKAASSATIATYVGKDARCNPARCDPRQHLQCKPVQTGTATEDRCVLESIAPIGGYCKNDKKEVVADCSRYARCADSSGQCARRNLETESCFPSVTTPGANDNGSCDPSVFGEDPLVCRQESTELSPHCHKALLQNLCSVQ